MRNDLLKEEGCGVEFPECSVASGFTYAVHIAKTAEVHILARTLNFLNQAADHNMSIPPFSF